MSKPTLEQLFERVKSYRTKDEQGNERFAFERAEIVRGGRLFHYTHHPDKVKAVGKLWGVPLDSDFFRTQGAAISHEATDPDGVVFFHETLERCCQGGWEPAIFFDPGSQCFIPRHKLEILEVEYSAAVRAFHTGDQEINLMTIASDCVIIRFTGKTGKELWTLKSRRSDPGAVSTLGKQSGLFDPNGVSIPLAVSVLPDEASAAPGPGRSVHIPSSSISTS